MFVSGWAVFALCLLGIGGWAYACYLTIFEHKLRRSHMENVKIQEEEFITHMDKFGVPEEEARIMLGKYDYPDLLKENRKLRKLNKKV